MGKSAASCFKIISCGSDSVDHDDLHTPESKGSGDRRRWSFRKRSARHRILSNSVISEAPASVSKENAESTAVNLQVQPELTIPEKTSLIQGTEEKTELSVHADAKLSDPRAPKEDDFRADATFDEPSVIIIQAAVRGLLGQRVLLKQKNIIKLQAVVRGHLVRRHAVGTLRCVQAIFKMQALVRARRTRLLVEGSGDFVKQRESSEQSNKEVQSSGRYTYVSIEKLLSNAFARQLMEVTPRTQPIHIKCDPLKSDSAWKWLERWMSVSSVSNEEPQESGAAVEQHNENSGHSDGKEDILVQTVSKLTDSESIIDTSAGPSNHYNLTSYDTNDINLFSNESVSASSSHSKLHNNGQSDSRCGVTETAPPEVKETDLVEAVEVQHLLKKEETGNDRDVPDLKIFSTEQPEIEGKKIPRKASNSAFIAAQSKFEEPSLAAASNSAFIAAQSKFEEPSLAAASAKLTTSSSHDPGVESSFDKVSSCTDQPWSKESELTDNAISNALEIQGDGSECGTELSISSTLDTPGKSETEVNDSQVELKVSDEAGHPGERENLELEAKSSVMEIDPSCTKTDKLEECESINSFAGESLDPAIPADSPNLEKKLETDPSHLQLELGSEASPHVNKSSPEASPRSHVIVPESQVTPSSQVSMKPKKRKGEKIESNRKNRPSSADKNLSNHNQDSASGSSLEQLQEHKSGKRRNSFGSAKPDHREQEPRDSSSSNSLPSYMQATESARAKAISNGSPRSSPDVHDKEIYIKKRHSLPGINERQGSPRIHRSLSQAQHNAKGNAIHSPQDRKWRR